MLNSTIDLILTNLNTFNRNTETFQRVEVVTETLLSDTSMSPFQIQDSLVIIATANK